MSNITYIPIFGLKQKMWHKRVSYQALADKAGVSKTTICRAANGQLITLFIANCIVEALGKITVQGHYRTGFAPDQKGRHV